MSNRPIREDQHGTITGYIYGCRLSCCVQAKRVYERDRAQAGAPQVGAEAVERVYAALEREADFDGVVIASAARLGELAALSSTSVGHAIHDLAERGRVQVVGHAAARGGPLEIHLSESA